MMERVRALFRPPVFEDEQKTRKASLAYLTAWLFVVLPLFYRILNPFLGASDNPILMLLVDVTVTGVGLVFVILVRKGYVQTASILMVLTLWLITLLMSANMGGVRDPSYALFIVVIVLAGLLLGGPASVVIVVLSVLAGWGLADAEVKGTLTLLYDPPYEVLINYMVIFAITAAVVTFSNRGFQILLRHVQESEHTLRSRNWELQQMRESLELRVEERTEDLERRSRYLEAAAQVAYAAGEILDAEELMHESVDLIREAFDLYYVGLFIVDGTGTWAILRAGTGEAGEQMLARNHRIRVGEGMVGWCVEHAQSRFAQHAEEDRVRLVAPELPETRAEAALPLRARGRVVGALTVQSAEADYFDEATVVVLQTMADLLAVALNNAELLQESQRAIAAVERAYGEVTSEAWSNLLQARGNWGYRYMNGTLRHIDGDGACAAATVTAMQNDELVLEQPQNDQPAAVAVPLRVGGKVIGAITYQRGSEQGAWDEDEVTVLRVLAEQLSQALDSARLLQETRQQAVREQQINDIAALLTNSVDVEAMLRATVQELGRLPGVLEASVHIDLPDPAPATADQRERP
jgi:GAF domain-containing protein